MKSCFAFGLELVVFSVLFAGCGYDPKKTTSASPEAGAPSAQAEVGGTAADLGTNQDSAAVKDGPGVTSGETGNPDRAEDGTGATAGAPETGATAGAPGTGGTSGAAGVTGSGVTGGATSLGGATSTETSSTGVVILSPDASPDRPADVPVVVSCPSPKAPEHGSVQAPVLTAGSEATFGCESGYVTPTPSKRKCQDDGTWSGTDPLCSLVDCGTPPSIANSKAEYSATTYQATAKYNCDQGFSPSASTLITCGIDGRWSTSSLVCNPVDCGRPPAAADIEVIAPVTTLNSVATYKCSTGFAPTGTTKTRTCQIDGTWSLPVPACHLADCGAPAKVTNGTVTAPKTTFNEVASYSCAAGFVLSGPTERVCQESETWAGAEPTCQAITPKLTINKTGSKLGTVTSVASTAINCGSTCSATFAYDSQVTITANADAGQSFVGWESPVCKGKLDCTIRLTSDTEVNAIFSPPPNIVFVTSTMQTPDLGGVAGADAICAARATAGGLTGTYRAWLSTSTVNAKDRLGTASGWVRPDGKPVLNQIKDIQSSKIFYPPSLDESGQPQFGNEGVITGTGSAGTPVGGSSFTTCGDWTSKVNEPGKSYEIGYQGASSDGITAFTATPCTASARLYCFGIDRTAFVAPDPTIAGRRAFTTSSTWSPGSGIGSADALCQKEATDAGLSGTFRALLTPTGASAASRFTGTDPWYRVDGLALATSASAFFNNTNLDTTPQLNARGDYQGRRTFWTGGLSMTAVGTNDWNCSNWTSTLATASAAAGWSDMALSSYFFANNVAYPCNASLNLVCMQTP